MKNSYNLVVFVVAVSFLLLVGSSANALMVSIENNSTNTQTALDLGFDSIGHIYIDYGGASLSPKGQQGSSLDFDYAQVTPDSIWTSYNLYPSNNTSNGWSIRVGDYIDAPLSLVGGTDSVILTFSSETSSETVIPEPASLLMLGTGITGLWLVSRKKS